MQLTTNYKLKKPEGSDVVNVQDFNDNADILDNALATHKHTKSQITDMPTTLKNPTALTVQFNGTTNKTYDGGSAQTVNITPSAIGAAPSNHNHDDRYYTEAEINSKINTINNNIGQLSNPNLLINGDFRINQRGQTTYTTTGKAIYTVDRWISYNLTDDTTEISVLNNGIKVKSTSRGNGRLRQTLEETDTKKLVGKTLTFSIKVLSDCSQCELITTKSRNVLGVSKKYTNVKAGDILSLTFDVTSDYTQVGVQFSSNDTNGISVAYAKLELGSVATPYQPKPYSQELADCQRYCQAQQLLGLPFRFGTNFIQASISTPVTLRTSPTLIGDITDWTIYNNNAVVQTGFTSTTVTSNCGGAVNIQFNKANHGLKVTDGIYFTTSDVILDAEIY